jgi:hypothetical protein
MSSDKERREISASIGKIILSVGRFPEDNVYISCIAPYDSLRFEAMLVIDFSTFRGERPPAVAEVLDYGRSVETLLTLKAQQEKLKAFADEVAEKLKEGYYDDIITRLFRE